MRADHFRHDPEWDVEDSVTMLYEKPEAVLQRVPEHSPLPVMPQPAIRTVSAMRAAPRAVPAPYYIPRHEMPSLPTIAARLAKTESVRRVSPGRITMVRVGFAAVCVLAGITVGTVIELGGRSSSRAHAAPVAAPVVAAPVAVVAPVAAPAPKMVVAPIVAAPVAIVPARTTVHVDSEPVGATATLVDNGVNTPIGTTPVTVDLDPSRSYDLVFALDGHQTRIEHVDPKLEQHVVVTLADDAPVGLVPAPVAPAPVIAPHHHTHVARVAPIAAAPRAPVAAAVAAGSGSLRISSKPACKIVIDGKATGLDTPQRTIALSAGRHTVTLINPDEGIHLTTSVVITANESTPLIRDFTN